MNRWLLKYFLLLLLVAISGCDPNSMLREKAKWRITLKQEDKNPYGAYLAYESLKYYFPNARIIALPQGFRYNNMSDEMKYNYYGHSLLILAGLDFRLSEKEWHDLKQFISNGNEVILFNSLLDSKIEQELSCYKTGSGGEENVAYYRSATDFDNRNILTFADSPEKKYGYEGRSLGAHFELRNPYSDIADSTGNDTAQNDVTGSDKDNAGMPDTLGLANDNPDIIRYTIGEGHLTLHAAPLVLSNYFLLQPGNINYLTALWKTLPKNISKVYWNGYYKRRTETSSYDILWRYPSTRLALILGICLLLLYVLFEGKRKQRIIPEMPPLKNDSVSFVETVGRLYYNKGNHTNLAEKMVQQFMEWVRTHYFLNTNLVNEHFIQQLIIKSGQPENTVRALVEMVNEIRAGAFHTDDAYLYQLYTTIQKFYKNRHN